MTEWKRRAAARASAQERLLEEAELRPSRLLEVLKGNPVLMDGIKDLDEIVRILVRSHHEEGLMALLHDRRTPRWARRIIASDLLAA